MTVGKSYREVSRQVIGSKNDENEFTFHDELMKLQETKDFYKEKELIANLFGISQTEEKVIIDKEEGTEAAI